MPTLGLCLLVGLAAYLMVFTMLGQIGASLHTSGTMLGWTIVATIIAATVCAALLPALGSVLGQRRLMTAAMGCLTAGSIVSAAAPGAGTLLAGRVIAAPGFAASVMSVVIVREHRSGVSLARSFGVIAGFAGGAAAVGFTLGGAVEQAAPGGWRWVFAAVAAVSAITAVLAAVTIPGGRPTSRRADVTGALLLAAGLVAALLPITEGAVWGWTSCRVTSLFAAAVVLLAAWAVIELRLADPLVRLGVLALPGVAAGTVLFTVTAATVGVVNLTVPPFLETPAAARYGAAASVLGAGLALLPFALAISAAGYLAGRLARRAPAWAIAVATLACEAVALVLLAGFHGTAAQVVILLAVFGAGHGGASAVAYLLLTGAAPAAAAGGAAGLASAADGISGATATAVTTALLMSAVIHVRTMTLPADAGYTRSWLFAAALAAAGAMATAIAAHAPRRGVPSQSRNGHQ